MTELNTEKEAAHIWNMCAVTGYTYFLPSPTQGKRFMIHGWLGPGEAAQMVSDIWNGKKTVDDFDCIQEIDD